MNPETFTRWHRQGFHLFWRCKSKPGRPGVHTELRLSRRRRGHNRQHTSQDIVEAVRLLVRICTDDLIAGVLNRHGLLTGYGNRWMRERVASLRAKRQIPSYCPRRQHAEGWMTLTQAAAFLGINPRTLRLAVEPGEVVGEHPLSDGPWVFNRGALETDAVTQFVKRAMSVQKGLQYQRHNRSALIFQPHSEVG